jgi:hypothetical protein
MQGIAHLVALAYELQDAVPVDRVHLVFTAVLLRAQSLRERSLAGSVACARRGSVQCFMGALAVVDHTSAVQRLLDLLQVLTHLPLSTSISSVQ